MTAPQETRRDSHERRADIGTAVLLIVIGLISIAILIGSELR